MKLSKIAMASALAMTLVTVGAQAASQGQGVVNFKGTVIDAPCGISPESADQTIDFGQISKAHLAANGSSIQKDLNIELVNCEFGNPATKNKVKVSFTGTTNGTTATALTELGTSGNTGTVIMVSQQGGADVKFDGTPGNPTTLVGETNTLHYSAYVKKGTGLTLTEGDFSAVAHFNLAYE